MAMMERDHGSDMRPLSMPAWIPRWLADEHMRLCALGELPDAIGWDEMESGEREVLTLALRNMWDEVNRRGA